MTQKETKAPNNTNTSVEAIQIAYRTEDLYDIDDPRNHVSSGHDLEM